MKPLCKRVVSLALLILVLATGVAFAQTDGNVQEVRRFFSGQRMLVSYRNGGAVYGTYVFLDVHLCESGRYMLFGQSRKQTVLDNEQVNNWRDNGVWDVTTFQGEAVLQYVSASGERNAVPVRLQPNGRVWLGNGVSVQRQGGAQCR